MYVKKIGIKNIRCFEKLDIEFSPGINILVGPNNSGKSTIIKSLAYLQYPGIINQNDFSKFSHKAHGEVTYEITGDEIEFKDKNRFFYAKLESNELIFSTEQSGKRFFPQSEPNNFIYPFLANRKQTNFGESVNQTETYTVRDNLHNLSARIASLNKTTHPSYKIYNDICNRIFGFTITATPSPNGMLPGYSIEHTKDINISSMGDGVPHIIGLLSMLSTSKNKLYLIEELENDLHPKALKCILELIQDSSIDNQFVISTHSSDVVRTLAGSDKVRIFQTNFDPNSYRSTVRQIESLDEKIELAEQMGFSLQPLIGYDFWFFFEEASTESLFNSILIPWFFPKLNGRIRTYSTAGIDNIPPRFEQFNQMMVFANLEPSLKNKVWVFIDAGDHETKILDSLKHTYCNQKNGWNNDQFIQFKKHSLEEYFPEKFQLSLNDTKNRNQKLSSLKNLIDWALESPAEARTAIENCFKEHIYILESISKKIEGK